MASVTQCDHCKKIKKEWELTWISVIFTLQGRGKKDCRHHQKYIDACSPECLQAHIQVEVKEFLNDSK